MLNQLIITIGILGVVFSVITTKDNSAKFVRHCEVCAMVQGVLK